MVQVVQVIYLVCGICTVSTS
uniref:Uncharacterized protein n=1 Tax=Arundo donax TaxID=35708 RepID=A0A0A9FQE6_ARUDO